MKVVVRCDSSTDIGSGHVIRCLTLADALSRRGAEVSFICRRLPGDLHRLVRQRGYRVSRLCADLHDGEEDAEKSLQFIATYGGADWLIVDHYGLDARFERQLRSIVPRILVLDDLADRPHDCDLLLDQNLYPAMDTRYHELLPASCRTLFGPSYALLRPEFLLERRQLRARRGELRRMLISFGGSDPSNETAKALAAVALLHTEPFPVDVVIGCSNPHAATLRAACAAHPCCTLHTQVDTMASLMSRADLALGSGGGTTWERCYLGLPSLTVVVASNQRAVTAAVAAAGATWDLGWHADLSARTLADRIAQLQDAPEILARASARCFSLMGDHPRGEEHPLVRLMYKGDDLVIAPHTA